MSILYLGIENLEQPEIKLEIDNNAMPSVNFGSGIELLMNDKKGEKKSSSNIEIEDENERAMCFATLNDQMPTN